MNQLSRRGARGQTLTLFAMTMVLVSIAAVLTLSLGMKVKERMELQTAADAAAYSNAVATARAVNAATIANRVMVAQTVSTLGSLSLLSWATAYQKHLIQAQDTMTLYLASAAAAFAIWTALCVACEGTCEACTYAVWCAINMGLSGISIAMYGSAIDEVTSRLSDDYRQLYLAEIKPRWDASNLLFEARRKSLRDAMETTPMTNRVMGNAGLARVGEVGELGSSGGINRREREVFRIDDDAEDANLGHVGQMVMASRGHHFIRDREDSTTRFTGPVMEAGGDIPLVWPATFEEDDGKGYLNPGPSRNPQGIPAGTWAHDEGGEQLTLTGLLHLNWPCNFAPIGLERILIALLTKDDVDDTHVGNWEHSGVHGGVLHADVTIPSFFDYNNAQLTDANDLFGQPKNYVFLQRSYSQQADPWDMRLRWPSNGGGNADQIDLVGGKKFSAQAGTARQAALGTGITYYHRPDRIGQLRDSPEAPNMFAPYWRAGLTSFAVDRSRQLVHQQNFDAEFTGMLQGAGLSEYVDAYNGLRDQGFKGIAR